MTDLPLPEPFARICNDGYWVLREAGTERFRLHDNRYESHIAQDVYSADQLHAYAAAKTAALVAEIAQVARYCEVLTEQHIADTAIEAERDTLQAEMAARKDWICPETYALTLQAVKSEAVRADAAEAECARLRVALEFARDEFEDKEHVARVRNQTGLADYYKGCKDYTDAALRGKETP